MTLGLGGVSGGSANRSIFNQYNILGLNGDNAAGGILGFDYILHDPENSNSFYFRGANLLDDSRELGLVWRDPGEWKFSATYGELVHQNPYTFNTGLVGAGSTTPQVVASARRCGHRERYPAADQAYGLRAGIQQVDFARTPVRDRLEEREQGRVEACPALA